MWQFARFLALFALVISCGASPKRYHGVHLEQTKNLKSVNGDRLNQDDKIQPVAYTIELKLLEENLKADDATFEGTVAIELAVQNEDLKNFNLHARDLDIKTIALAEKDGDGSDTINITPIPKPDPANDFLNIKLEGDAVLTNKKHYILTITYVGSLSDTDMLGFYKSSYKNADGNIEYLATTQFEEMGARKAFPCFDEPAIKAKFTIIVSHSDGYKVVSNNEGTEEDGDNGLKKTTFTETELMSTYLVAFIVSKLNCEQGADILTSVKSFVCARHDVPTAQKDLAFAVAPQVLGKMKDYSNLEYGKDLKKTKMTQAAIPDFNAGAMENWGLVTYREADLLYSEDESSNYYKQSILSVIAHEFAHQWFGDYVTLDWWSDVFLNEGFATYFEYYVAAQTDEAKNWELEKQFVVEQLQRVLYTDSTGQTVPLHSDPKNSDEISAKFDDISYNKGGSILRMMHHFFKEDNFKKALVMYLNIKASDKIGAPDKLWSAFDDTLIALPDADKPKVPEDISIAKIMENWTNKNGYPLLTVALSGDNITISQKQIALNSDDTKWYVPITYSTKKSNDFTKTDTQEWLTPDSDLTIKLETDWTWVVLNNQQVGYYRVKYDDALLKKIQDALTAKHEDIDEISRSQIVDDLLNLARTNDKKYTDVLSFLSFLKSEDSYYTWYSAFNGFSYLLKRTSNEKAKNSLKAFIKDQMAALLKDVPIEGAKFDDQVKTLKLVLAQTWACNLDEETCVNAATDLYTKSTGDKPEAINPNLRSFVYCTALRKGNKDHYASLWTKYTETDLATEKVTILKALGCTSDLDSRKAYLKEAISENVRRQDVSYVFQSVYSNGHADDVVDFIKTNFTDIKTYFGDDYTSTLSGLINAAADQFTTQAQIDTLNALKQADGVKDDDDVKAAIEAAAKIAEDNLKITTDLDTQLADYFKDTTGSASINSNVLFTNLVLALAVYFMYNLY